MILIPMERLDALSENKIWLTQWLIDEYENLYDELGITEKVPTISDIMALNLILINPTYNLEKESDIYVFNFDGQSKSFGYERY